MNSSPLPMIWRSWRWTIRSNPRKRLLALPFDGATVAEKLVEKTGIIGEKIEIADFQTVSGDQHCVLHSRRQQDRSACFLQGWRQSGRAKVLPKRRDAHRCDESFDSSPGGVRRGIRRQRNRSDSRSNHCRKRSERTRKSRQTAEERAAVCQSTAIDSGSHGGGRGSDQGGTARPKENPKRSGTRSSPESSIASSPTTPFWTTSDAC